MRLKRVLTVGAILGILALAHLISSVARQPSASVSSLYDLDQADRRIGVIAGHDAENVARSVLSHARIVPMSDPEEAVVALLAGRLDAFVHDEHVLNVRRRAYPNRLRVLDEELARSPAVIRISRRRPELKAAIDRFIRNARLVGMTDDMFVRWCQSDRFVPMPKIPETRRTDGVLRVGTSATEEPSSFCDDAGELSGYDIEFVRRLAQMMRCELQIVCRPADQLDKALSGGEIDLLVDDCKAHDASAGELVSDVYFETDVKVMVKAGDDAAAMLGPRRLGWSGRLVRDPRLGWLFTGVLTTVAVIVLAGVLGLALTLAFHVLARRLSGTVLRDAFEFVLEALRLVPPPVMMLAAGCLLTGASIGWLVVVLTLSLRFAAFVEPTFFTDRRSAIRETVGRMVELVQWSTVMGLLNVCDLTQVADFLCGRTPIALGTMVSVAAAYCLVIWCIRRVGDWLEGRFA